MPWTISMAVMIALPNAIDPSEVVDARTNERADMPGLGWSSKYQPGGLSGGGERTYR
jgi:hypothetical protein